MPTTASNTAVSINGPALREIRKRTGLGVRALAEEVGVGRPYIAQLELGHKTRVSPEVYSAILSALHISDHRVLLATPEQVPA